MQSLVLGVLSVCVCVRRPEAMGGSVEVEEVGEVGRGQVVEGFTVRSSILKSIRYLTGSQWRSWSTGVWSEWRVEVSVRAAEFLPYCSLLRMCFDDPYRMEIQ